MMAAMRVGANHPALRVRKFYRRSPSTFDGNLSADPTNWLFPTEDFDELTDDALEELITRTAQGNLSWIIFPPSGYRL